VIAEAAAVRVMGQDVDRTVVVHEPVEDMDRFAGGAGDDLYMEGRIAIRDVRVELDDRVAAIAGVHGAAGLAFAAEVEVLPVR
jgi:hypothetical protein